MRHIITILAVVLIAGAVTAAAQCKILAMADELGLTDQQKKQIEQSLISEKRDLIQLKADLAKAKLDLQEVMMADKIDKAAAMKKSDQISAIKAEIAKKKLAGRIDRLNLLNAEQRGKLRDAGRPGPRLKERMRLRDCPPPHMGRIGREDCPRMLSPRTD